MPANGVVVLPKEVLAVVVNRSLALRDGVVVIAGDIAAYRATIRISRVHNASFAGC